MSLPAWFELVSLDSGQLIFEFVNNELICSVPVVVIENDRVTKVHGVREERRNRENCSNKSFGMAVNMLAEKDGGLLKVGGLTRQIAEVIQDASIISSLMD